MSQIVVHGVPGSPFVRTVLIGAIEKGAPWRLQPMAVSDMRGPAHYAMNPFGRIPTIEHDGFRLYESQAILRYLDQVFPDPPLTPADAQAAARMNQLMGIADWYVFPSVSSGVTFNRVVAPRLGFPVNEAAVADALPKAKICVDALEDFLGDKPYFAGDTLTLADIMLIPGFDLFAETEEGRGQMAGTKLARWVSRMQARPSVQNTTWDNLTKALAA